jgi:DNA adenine methylase
MSKRKIINVASVPQRSPFRYPGGKTWLVPLARAWLRSLRRKPRLFVEPFAGGGSITLTVASESLADHVLMVELDKDVAAVWETLFSGQGKWLAARIMDFDVSVESVKEELAKIPSSVRQRAFQTILKNRVYHGGIMAHGSAMIRHGENGKGIKSRWYPTTLKRRILDIDALTNVEFIEGDGMEVVKKKAANKTAVFFIDPPYTATGKKAGKRLYSHNELDHERLFDLAAKIAGDFLMTYDNAEGVIEMATRRGFDTEVVAMKNTHHAEMTELLIGRNLEWARAIGKTKE